MAGRFNLCWVAAGLACSACAAAEFAPRMIGGAGVSQGAPAEMLRSAQAQFRQGNTALALQEFRKVMRREPDSIDALAGIAACYDRMGRFELSRRYYEEALALAPRDERLRHNFALSLRMQGRAEEAERFRAETSTTPATASVTIELPPPAAPWSDRSQPAEPKLWLKRLSLNEVEIVIGAASAIPSRTVRASPGASPIRATGKERVGRPAAHAAIASLRLLNGVGRRGMAARMKAYLSKRGWNQAATGDARARPIRSFIVYPRGRRASAGALAARLPFPALLKEKAGGSELVLMLGRDALVFDERLRRGAASS